MNSPPIKYQALKEDPFYTELSERVNQYFKVNKLSKKGNWKVFLKMGVFFSMVLVPYILFLTNQFDSKSVYFLIPLLGIGLAGISLNVQHEGSHGAFSKHGWVNRIMEGTMYIIGGNAENWNFAHNQLHHSYVNIFGHDNDLNGRGVIRLSPEDKWLPIHRYQHFYFLIFYGLLSINWMLYTDFRQLWIFNKMRKATGQTVSQFQSWFKLLFFKLLMLSTWFVLPLYFMEVSVINFLLGFLCVNLISSTILSFSIQAAHIVIQSQMIKPHQDGSLEHSWAVQQLLTTTNWATKSELVNWYTGGLNHQIEHHLFPNISHIHYPKISGIVKEVAKNHGIAYHENETMFQVIRSHIVHLKNMGKDPRVS